MKKATCPKCSNDELLVEQKVTEQYEVFVDEDGNPCWNSSQDNPEYTEVALGDRHIVCIACGYREELSTECDGGSLLKTDLFGGDDEDECEDEE